MDRVVGPDAGDDLRAVADCFVDDPDQLLLLRVRCRRRLPRRTGDDEPVVACIDEMGGESLGRVLVDRTV